jgi:hypothetical protein
MDIRRIFRFLEDIEARRKGVKVWFALVLSWSIIRSAIIARVFHKYGLNPTLYFVIDFLSSLVYAQASAQSLLAYLDKKKSQAIWWAVATIPSFYAPDIYIIYSSKKVPTSTYIGFGVILAAFSLFAIYQWADSRKGRRGSGQ